MALWFWVPGFHFASRLCHDEHDVQLAPGPGGQSTGEPGQGGRGGLSVQRQLDGKSVPCRPHPPVLGSKIFGVDYQGTLGAVLKLFPPLKNKIELTSCGFK